MLKDHPSWIPTLNLGYKRKKEALSVERFQRLENRKKQKLNLDAAQSLLQLGDLKPQKVEDSLSDGAYLN